MMYFEPPQLAYWDSTKNNWRLDALTDSQYNEGISIKHSSNKQFFNKEHQPVYKKYFFTPR